MALVTVNLPSVLYSQTAVHAAEQALLDIGEVTAFGLVERAAAAAFALLGNYQRQNCQIVIVAGKGNNGADALVLGRLLLEHGNCPSMMLLGEGKTDEHQRALQQFIAAGGEVRPFDVEVLQHCDLIVDGLLGIGVSGELTAELNMCVEAINLSPAFVLSLDLPSGVHADTGNVASVAVAANVTLCFGALKQGLFTSRARHFAGEVYFADIGLGSATALLPHSAIRVDAAYLTNLLGKRARDSHKGKSGKVTVIGGNYGMAGAVRLAGEACLRGGAGLVTVISRPAHQMTVNANRPELMFWGCELVDMEVYLRLGWADVLVLGPGLGKDDWSYNLFKAVGLTDKPCVLDADALNILAKEPSKQLNRVITPHPGEAARLLGVSIAEIEADRFDAIRQLHNLYGGVVVLKGAGTLIYDGDALVVAPVGNPGLASGGCGDVLSGIIAALMAQGLNTMTAAVAGVVVHGEAADLAAKDGERGMLASDLMPFIRQLVNSALI